MTPRSRARRIVLYGVGSPLVIDAEEACVRAGIEIVAAVRNVDGPVHVSSAVRVVTAAEITAAERTLGVVAAVFTPGARRAAFSDALRAGFSHGDTVIDPTSPVARSADIGEGVFVNAGCVIAGGSRLDDWVLVNRSASIGHHVRIGEYASIGPGCVLCGNVTLGRGVVLGAGVTVLPETQIGDNAVVAAGSVVRGLVAAQTLTAGNPGRVVKTGIGGYKGFAI